MMEHLIQRIEQLEYYLSLLLMTVDQKQSPFIYLVISKKIEKDKIQQLLVNCDKLDTTIQQQKEEGLLCFDSFFSTFQSILPAELDEKEVLESFKIQKMYPVLVKELWKYV